MTDPLPALLVYGRGIDHRVLRTMLPGWYVLPIGAALVGLRCSRIVVLHGSRSVTDRDTAWIEQELSLKLPPGGVVGHID